MEVYLGIDLGTSCVKTAFLDRDGNIPAVGSSDISLELPHPGYAEQDPAEWWEAVRLAVAEAKAKCPEAEISGIGISGQMLGTVLLDERGALTDSCIIWLDQRADEENEEMKRLLGTEEILRLTSNFPLVSYWAPKLLWLKKHKPEVYERTAHVLFPKDYLKYMLTGVMDIDATDAAGTGLFRTEKREWCEALFEKLGISRSLVPESVSESVDVIGHVTKQAAEFLGIREGVPVVGGGGDQMCGAVGLGIVKEGMLSSTIGTSGCVFSYSETCVTDMEPRALLSYCHSVPGSWCVYGCTLSAGGSLRWLRDLLFDGEKSFSYMTDLAQQSVPGAEGLVFLPYLNGERTPHPNPDARGVFFGMSIRHTKADMIRSVMEGVAYSLRDTIEIMKAKGIRVKEVRAAGGGAVSELWRQIQADVFGARVVTTNVKEAPATGAAMLAAVGAGAFESLAEAADKTVKPETVTVPVEEHVKLYNDFYETYGKLYDQLEDLFALQAGKVRRWEKK